MTSECPTSNRSEGIMKARGVVSSVGNGCTWWATIRWMPPGAADGNGASLETDFQISELSAKQAAEDYAAKLGLEIEWEQEAT